ncbi:hypothetical protein C0992_003908 [Termitomyces sp. T32_za158]|nr:hypothetical protein C0992_003908 [Termitomyces sp. T32_za158]
MNSPEPGSPISTDTESPPPEETNAHLSPSNFGTHLVSQITQTFAGGSKRRLPGGTSVGGPSVMRDSKMRRKIEQAKGTNVNLANATWDSSKETKREERELVDHHLVDYLRKGPLFHADKSNGRTDLNFDA